MTEMKLDTKYFNYIKDGKKIYETRIYDQKRKNIKLLDEIKFVDRSSDNFFTATVIELSYFDNFRDAIEEVGVKKILPNAKSLDNAVDIYNSFNGGRYQLDAKKYGVLRIRFKLNPNPQ